MMGTYILVRVDRTFALPYALRVVYDPETSAWTDLATPTGGRVVGMHRGSLVCLNLRRPRSYALEQLALAMI